MTIVTLADSISDGYQSNVDANRPIARLFVERLQETPLRDLAVTDQGSFGTVRFRKASARPLSQRDVLSRAVPRHVASSPEGITFLVAFQGARQFAFPDHSGQPALYLTGL